ncbi:MAG: DEAD/DEAH box helicase family protein, partial [Planctomycetota bacterium]|nr:DEAD/DEAH box helicase family protein [Planctomycetota bacterium]
MELRYYQAEAKAAIYKYLSDNPGKNPVAVLPTGSGKSPLLAAMCADVVNAGKRA